MKLSTQSDGLFSTLYASRIFIGNKGAMGPTGATGPTGPGGGGGSGIPQALDSDALVIGATDTSTRTGSTSVGIRSLNLTGIGNTAVGFETLFVTGATNYNTAFGYRALKNSAGQYNTAVGTNALTNNTTGQYNTALGRLALSNVTSGNNNIAIGPSCLSSTTTSSYIIGIGNSISQRNYDILIGYDTAGSVVSTATNSIVIGYKATAGAYSASGGLFFPGTGAGGTPLGVVGPGIGAAVRYDPDTGQMGPDTGSSIRYKTNIAPIETDTSLIYSLNAKSFDYISHPGTRCFGYTAEEMDEILPQVVLRDGSGTPINIRYELLTVLLIEEIKKLKSRLDNSGL